MRYDGRRLPDAFSLIIHGEMRPILSAHNTGLRIGSRLEHILTSAHAPPDYLAPWGITLEVYDPLGRLGADGIVRWRQLMEIQRRREAERQQLILL